MSYSIQFLEYIILQQIFYHTYETTTGFQENEIFKYIFGYPSTTLHIYSIIQNIKSLSNAIIYQTICNINIKFNANTFTKCIK